MIPKVNRIELEEIRSEVRRASGSNWNLWQRFKIFFDENSDVSLDFAIVVPVLIAVACLVFIASMYFVVRSAGFSIQFNSITPEESARWISFVSALTGVLAFVCFAGGPSRKLHETCLRYPHRDESVGRYIYIRTLIAGAILFTGNVIVCAAYALKFAHVEFRCDSVFLFSVLQTLFQLSFVLILARRWVPPVKDCSFWASGFLLLIPALFGPLVLHGEGAEELRQDAGLMAVYQFTQLYMTPHAWMANVWFCFDLLNPVAVFAFIATISYCILKGGKCFVQLLHMSPSDSLDGELDLLESYLESAREFEIRSLEIRNLDEAKVEAEGLSTADSVMECVAEFENELGDRSPKTMVVDFLHRTYHPSFLEGAPRWWQLICVCATSLCLLIPIVAVVGFIAACFKSPTDLDSRQMARLVSAAILFVPVVFSLGELTKVDRAALYPISDWSLRRRVLKRMWQFMVWVLPIWVGLNVAFCLFYEIGLWAKVRLVAEPFSVVLSCIVILAAVTSAAKQGTKPSLLAMAVICLYLFVFASAFVLFPIADVNLQGKSLPGVEFKSIFLVAFAAIFGFALIVINDQCSFDIRSRSGFAVDLNMKLTKREMEIARQ